MEELSSPANDPSESPASNESKIWSRWWIRVLLFIAHLTLLAATLSLTPDGYSFKSGEILGMPIFLGSLFLWVFVWFAKRRFTVLLFCGLALAQIGLIALVTLQFRREDKVLRSVDAESAQDLKLWKTQMASFHVEQIFEMLNPENEFHPEELPGLLDRVHAAIATDTKHWAEMDAWANDGEKRVAEVSRERAAEFRRGFESARARNQRVQQLNKDYLIEVENLITLLIDRQGHYHSTKTGLAFDHQKDLDAFNQELSNLKAIQAKVQAQQRNDSNNKATD